jgi:S-formylglutathione hydrolase FrmB
VLDPGGAEGTAERDVLTELMQDYDHSYYFISSFAEDHVSHAAKYLGV